MEMTQTQRLPVPQQVAWEALNDPALLKQCIPGCESIEPDGENAYQLVLTAAVGPVKARFKGRMALQDIHAPDSYTIQFDGQGGAAGFGVSESAKALVRSLLPPPSRWRDAQHIKRQTSAVYPLFRTERGPKRGQRVPRRSHGAALAHPSLHRAERV